MRGRLFAMPTAMRRAMRRAMRGGAGVLLLAFCASESLAQLRPDLAWRTIATEHFRVHFTAELEGLARRTARNAETAWGELARELVAPRGLVDIVVADNVDYANGFATPFPTSRIVVYARPPVEELSLRNHADWNKELVTHELTHIFHLDRARGWWGVAQRVFGRAPPFFPNSYAPAWITEGLAVHYETRFGAGGGRLAGTEFRTLVRAAALDGKLPPLDALSLTALHFPRGNVAYLYGSFAMSHVEPVLMRRYVEIASARMIPWRQNANARDAFGSSFTKRWQEWRDSVTRVESGVRLDEAGAGGAGAAPRALTTHKYTARFPRFVSAQELLYVAEDGRSTTGRYSLTLDGKRRRLGRQNALDASAPLAGGGTVQGELDYIGPYSIRSDLTRSGGERAVAGVRRTKGERLSHPDVHRASGRIVAVQTVPGSTRLVMMDALGAPISELAAGSLNVNWSEPRWSYDGTRVAAARWEDGGRTSIVVLDRAGRVERVFAPGSRPLSIVSSPAWIPGDTSLLFVSDHEGRAMIYRGDLRSGGYARVWASETGLNTPDVSPDGMRIAAVELTSTGYRVVTRPMPGPLPLVASVPTEPGNDVARSEAARSEMTAPANAYSPWRTLLPRWWLPVIASTDPGTPRVGFMTNARDAVDRHAYGFSASLEPKREELTADLVYRYSGFGLPVLTFAATQDWAHGAISDTSGAFVGYLGRVDRVTSLSATFSRPRVRHASALTVGGELQSFSYRTYPASLLPLLSSGALLRTFDRQALFVSVTLSTLQRSALAVSSENGISISFTQRQRFQSGVNFEDVAETTVSASLAKSIPLPGFARHVFAARAAYGITGHAATSGFGVGGVSGGSVEIVPTVVIGDPRRTFFVRGFEGGSQVGVRALAGSVEYRAPLALAGRGIGLLPLFFQKTSFTAFADAGAAWCNFPVNRSFLCRAPLPPRATMASVGGELAIDAALNYDTLYRFRFGVAHPVRGQGIARRPTTFYFTLGSTF